MIAINLDFGNAEKRWFPYNQINKVCTERPAAAELVQRIRNVYCALAYSHLCNLIPIISCAVTLRSTSITWEMSKVNSLKFNCILKQACELLAGNNIFLFAMNHPSCKFSGSSSLGNNVFLLKNKSVSKAGEKKYWVLI